MRALKSEIMVVNRLNAAALNSHSKAKIVCVGKSVPPLKTKGR